MQNDELESYEKALRILLDSAEKRNYDPPVPSTIICEIETKISELKGK